MEPSRSEPAPLEVTLVESRYDRQERVSWWDQRRLASARILVVGAGALGNEVVKNLALVGVGNIVVIDGDVVEASNLARCVFFRPEDEGKPKALAVAARARELNADVEVDGIVGDVRSLGTGVAWRADVIVGALDNREARLFCNRLAARAGRSWVDGAIEALSGVARVFSPPDVCYECTLTEQDWEMLAHRQSCRLLSRDDLAAGKVPTTASTSSIVAGLEAQEVVKLLHRDRDGVRPLAGGIVIDGANNDSYPLRYPTDENCLAHDRFEDVLVLGPDSDLESLTARELVARAWPDTDPAECVVDLGDDLVVGWHCTACGRLDDDGRPAALVAWGDALCPDCNEPRQPDFIASLAPADRLADEPLRKIGVRPDEALAVHRGAETRHVWLAGGDPRFPAAWTGQPDVADDSYRSREPA